MTIRAMTIRHVDRQQGFVLPAVIAAVAVLALVAAVIGGWMADSLGRAAASQDRIEADAQIHGAVQAIAWRLATGRLTADGLHGTLAAPAGPGRPAEPAGRIASGPAIAVDGRPYRSGPVILRLMDGRGLYNLNAMDELGLGELLRQFGVPLDQRALLTQSLLDYMTPPTPQTPPALEDEAYQRAGLPPPRHRPLLTPWELQRVLHWADTDSLWSGPAALPAVTGADQVQGVNVNTAGLTVLLTIPGMSRATAEKVLDYRSRRVISNDAELLAAMGAEGRIDPLHNFTLPANTLRLSLRAPGEPLLQLRSITLTPTGSAPTRIDYAVALPPDRGDPSPAELVELPPVLTSPTGR